MLSKINLKYATMTAFQFYKSRSWLGLDLISYNDDMISTPLMAVPKLWQGLLRTSGSKGQPH